MKDLDIAATTRTPEVITDIQQGNIFFTGPIFPDNAWEFYEPFYKWLDKYFQTPHKQTTLFFQFTYISTTAFNMFLDLLKKLKGYQEKGLAVKIVWLFKENDEDMEETGEDFQDIAKIPFEVKSIG